MFEIITTKGELYDKCENMEELYDNFYYPLLVEHKELKKQLEDKTEDYKRMKDNFDSKVDVITEIDNQQKGFIKYLENYMKQMVDDYGSFKYDKTSVTSGEYKAYKEILQKYKEIIGDRTS